MMPTQAILDGIARARAEGRILSESAFGPAGAVPADVSEKEFLQTVINLAKQNGWLVYHTWNSRKSAAGFPDLVLLRNGVLIVAELKVGANTVSPAQQQWLDAFAAAGIAALVWRPEDWPEVEKALA